MPTIGQSISKTDLLQRARDFQAATAANQAQPYQKALKEESDCFISCLQKAQDGSLSDIKAAALQQSAALQKKATIASFAGMGLMIASLMLPIPGGNLVHLAGMGGGFYLSQVVGGRAAAEAGRQRYFASQLGEWQRAVDASVTQPPAQPAPAPAQPPAQPAAAQPQA